jgi:hypothetical protein
MMTFASASLHHSKCRPSRWNDDVLVSASPHPTLAHHTACILLPIVIAEAAEPTLKPFMLVNPGLEQVFLGRGPLGQWKVIPNGAFSDAGLKSPPIPMDAPVAGVSAVLAGNMLSAVFENRLLGPYDVTLSQQARDLVESEDGVMFVITHAIDPHDLTHDINLDPVMRGDRTVMGWIELGRQRL